MKSLNSIILESRKLGLGIEFMIIWVWICSSDFIDRHCFNRYKSFSVREWWRTFGSAKARWRENRFDEGFVLSISEIQKISFGEPRKSKKNATQILQSHGKQFHWFCIEKMLPS